MSVSGRQAAEAVDFIQHEIEPVNKCYYLAVGCITLFHVKTE